MSSNIITVICFLNGLNIFFYCVFAPSGRQKNILSRLPAGQSGPPPSRFPDAGGMKEPHQAENMRNNSPFPLRELCRFLHVFSNVFIRLLPPEKTAGNGNQKRSPHPPAAVIVISREQCFLQMKSRKFRIYRTSDEG